MANARHICLICHNEIPHPGAECPHCKSRVSSSVAVTPLLLVLIFGVMVTLFVATGFLTRSFRQERRSRAQIHYQLAQTLADYGYYRKAIGEYRESLTYLPDKPESRLGLAQALYYLGRYSEAETHLLDLRNSDPTWALVNRLLARIAAQRGDVEEAVNYYRTAIYGRWEQNPAENRIKVRLELVDLLRRHGQSVQVVGELLELRNEAPQDRELKKRIAQLFLEAGAPSYALEVFDELVQSGQRDAEAYAGKGEAEFALGNYLSAQTAFRQANRLGAKDEWIAERLRLCGEIINLDPTFRGGRLTRLRRSQELLERTVAAVERCVNPREDAEFVGPPKPPPPAVEVWLEKARQVISQKRRQRPQDETIEENISVAVDLWKVGQEVCAGLEPSDPALVRVLNKLSL